MFWVIDRRSFHREPRFTPFKRHRAAVHFYRKILRQFQSTPLNNGPSVVVMCLVEGAVFRELDRHGTLTLDPEIAMTEKMLNA